MWDNKNKVWNKYNRQRTSNKGVPSYIPVEEWRKIMGMIQEEVVNKNIKNTTNYYLSVEAENRQDPRRHCKCCYPGLRYPIQQETAASNTFFPTIKYSRGNFCSPFFVGTKSD